MSRSNEDFSVGVHGGNTSSELYLLAYKPDPHGINTTNYCTHDASHTRRTQAHPTIRCSSSARGARCLKTDLQQRNSSKQCFVVCALWRCRAKQNWRLHE